MTTLYTDTVRLELVTGTEVQAFVQVDAAKPRRQKCLFLHGNPGSLLDWARLLPRLSDVADLAAIDMPGFGRSPRAGSTPDSLSLDKLAEHVIAAADALSWQDPFLLVGHSHGGGVAQAAAAKYPDRIAGLVLLSTLGAPAHQSYRLLSLPGATAVAAIAGRLFRSTALRAVSRRVLHGTMIDVFSPQPVPKERVEHQLALFLERPEVLISMVQVTLGRPCSQLLASASAIRCPALFLHGEQDALVPAKCARSIHEALLNAGGRSEFKMIDGAGHMLVEFQAAQVAENIAHFLRTY